MSSLMAEWKLEPASPLLDVDHDAWLFFEDDVTSPFADDFEEKPRQRPEPTSRAEAAQQLLDDIDDFVKKEETLDWFEEKVDLPLLDDLQPSACPGTTQLLPQLPLSFAFPEGDLTPPQSPPSFEKAVRIALQPTVDLTQIAFAPPQTYITLLSEEKPVVQSFLSAPPTPIPDLAREMADVDEFVRDTAQRLDLEWESETSHSETTSDGSEHTPSPRSSTSEESDDPEWVPSVSSCKATSRPGRKPKPYSRCGNVEDKRLRKKEQNKNAATRYRQKKKAEVSVIAEEERQLEDRSTELEQKVTDLQTEIKYLKGLMRDMFRAKGLIQ